MEAVNDDDEAMMAMMGMTGFGSTKVRVPLRPCGVTLILFCRASTSPEIKRAPPMSRNSEHGDST